MAGRPDHTADARERGRQVLAAAVAVRGQLAGHLSALRRVLPRHLPEGTPVSETFVLAAEEQLDRGRGMLGLVQTELQDGARPESLEIAVTMLENVLEVLADIVRKVHGSLTPFLEAPRPREGRGGADAEASLAQAELSPIQDALAGCHERVEALRRSRRALEEDARAAIARELWARLSPALDEEVLLSLWQQILRGVGRFDRLAEGAGLDDERLEKLKLHLLTTALRLEAEVADFDRDRRIQAEPDGPPAPPAPGAGHAGGDTRPLVVKLAAPDPVALGEVFQIELLVRNDHTLPEVLDSVDVDARFLEGFDVVEVRPPPQERSEAEGWTLEYEREIAPGDTLALALTLRARRLGNHTGEITVWTGEVEVSTAIPNIDVVLLQ